MKFLNTKYLGLFDTTSGFNSDSTNDVLVTADSSYASTAFKSIINLTSTTSIYVSFLLRSTFYANSSLPWAYAFNITTTTGAKNLNLSYTNTQIRFNNGNSDFEYIYDVPSTSVTVSGRSYYQRKIMVHFDTVQNLAELYSDGVFIASFSCVNSGEYIKGISLGKITSTISNTFFVQLGEIIISDSLVNPLEKVTEISPTITSTDWTVSNGKASTETVNGTMALTAPSGSIDETKRTVTGYSVAFIDCSSTPTINTLDVAQGADSQQVTIPDGLSVETLNSFAVSQLSGISTTVTATYVSP
jgi:hypothetical protein